jgi:Fic family protein
MKNNSFSKRISVFHGMLTPEEATLVGYGAIIDKLKLELPLPTKLSLISDKRKSYDSENWKVYSSRNSFEDTLYKHLVFAIKYEGINLLFFKKLFTKLTKAEVLNLLIEEPTGQYSRKMWFLYEWLMNEKLKIPDLTIKNYIPLIHEKQQYAISPGERSGRHRIINNLPGTKDFCPLITKTKKLETFIASDFSNEKNNYLSGIKRDVLLRASVFLLLKDSKASFNIEGEAPKNNRAVRWGQAIGQAGMKDLTKDELLRLQQIVIENDRFVNMGFRTEGGFVGEYDRITGKPIPEHISARFDDLDILLDGLISTNDLFLKDKINAVLAASVIAFGFVFIHPFEDGNGRIHRYLIHHLLAKKDFTQQGIIFPISASILNRIDDYRKVLESYSQSLLDFIEWEETTKNNVKVINDTIDFYRYFDATKQAEFLFECVEDTVKNIIPNEVKYLIKFDLFKEYLDDEFEMPDNTVALLVRFLEQNDGKLSNRAKEKEFAKLTENEVSEIENTYRKIFA